MRKDEGMTLTDFLEARIAEDETVARTAGPDGGDWYSRYPEQPDCHMAGEFGWTISGPGVETEDSEWGKAVADHIARHDPARVLAECEAKRRIVEEHGGRAPFFVDPCDAQDSSGHTIPCDTVRFLALPYADHPDYRDEWRP